MRTGSLAVSSSVRFEEMESKIVDKGGQRVVAWSRAKSEAKVRINGLGASLGCDNGRTNIEPFGFLIQHKIINLR